MYDAGSLIGIGKRALHKAYLLQVRLMKDGTAGEILSKNAQGDKSTRADLESEIEAIKVFKDANAPVRIIAEEHGLVDIVENPRYLAVLDGVDGSSGLVANPRSRCGTMLAIASTLDPKYNEFFFGGITEFSTNRIFYGIIGEGTFLVNDPNKMDDVSRIHRREIKKFDRGIRIHVDDCKLCPDYESNVTAGIDKISALVRETFSLKAERNGNRLSALNSSAAMCIDLIMGEVDLVGGVIAKGAFEPPTEYVLVTGVGGVMTDIDGNDIGCKKWKEYGRNTIPLVRASSRELGNTFAEFCQP